MSAAPRKRTRFNWCEAHQWLRGERRGRQAEYAAEGGPCSPCAPRPCRVYAGTDLFNAAVCAGEYVSEHGGDWARGSVPKPIRWSDLFGIDPDYLEGAAAEEWLEANRGEA